MTWFIQIDKDGKKCIQKNVLRLLLHMVLITFYEFNLQLNFKSLSYKVFVKTFPAGLYYMMIFYYVI